MDSLKNKLTEEEVQALFDDTCYSHEQMRFCDELEKIWKERGYIKQNPVEGAEKLMEEFDDICRRNETFTGSRKDYYIFRDAINHLKKKLEEKNNDK